MRLTTFALLHPLGPVDSGAGHRARYPGRTAPGGGDLRGRGGRSGTPQTRQAFVARCRTRPSARTRRASSKEEQAIAEATARLRNEDYQLAYAIDILTGLNALGPRGD